MSMVLVGSGPSSPQYAAEIDQCDTIVRMNAFPFDEAGSRWHIWASFLAGRGHQRAMNRWNLPGMVAKHGMAELTEAERLPREIWLMVPPGVPGKPRRTGKQARTEGEERRWLRMMHLDTWETADSWARSQIGQIFKHTGARNIDLARIPLEGWNRIVPLVSKAPGTGLRCIQMALERKPEQLVIVGFDAYGPDRAGWGHWNPSFQGEWIVGKKSPYHSWHSEQGIISRWVQTRKFCGQMYPDTEPVWWRLKK